MAERKIVSSLQQLAHETTRYVGDVLAESSGIAAYKVVQNTTIKEEEYIPFVKDDKKDRTRLALLAAGLAIALPASAEMVLTDPVRYEEQKGQIAPKLYIGGAYRPLADFVGCVVPKVVFTSVAATTRNVEEGLLAATASKAAWNIGTHMYVDVLPSALNATGKLISKGAHSRVGKAIGNFLGKLITIEDNIGM